VLLVVCLAFNKQLTGYPTPVYMAFLGAGLISQTFGYSVIGYALGHLPASVVAPTIVAQPVITSLLAIPLFGESLYAAQWIGGFIVLIGIYLVNVSRKASPEAVPPELPQTQPE
jgi:drug/metabolite transporter (DMT)-like permease